MAEVWRRILSGIPTRARVITESRVMPDRIVPPQGGVTSVPSRYTKKTFMPPSSSMYRRCTASRNTTCSYPCSTACAWAMRLAA